jgi:uncharacterized membrane protein YkvI
MLKAKNIINLHRKKMASPSVEQVHSSSFQTTLKEYVKQNWGSPFIVLFILLLLTAAVLLSAGSAYWAEQVALYAYYTIVAGVVLQIICFVKYRKNSSDEEI